MNNISPITFSINTSNPKLNPQQPFRISAENIQAVHKIGENTNPKNIHAKMLLSLVKGGLNGDKVTDKIFTGRTYEDWVHMYNLGLENAILPLAYDGIKNSPNIKIPEDVRENMEINTKFVKKYHTRQENVLKELTEMTAKEGIDTVQMKGLGYSLNYPNPQRRFGGDIDVFNFKHGTDFSNPENNMSLEVDKILQKNGAKMDGHQSYKHSEARIKDMPIENHRSFLNVKEGPIAEKLNKYLSKNLNPQKQTLPNGAKILVPSKEFNNVFISFHAMQHYVGGGINFHHLTDWAVHVKKNGLHIPEEVKGTKFEQFMNAFTNLADKHLGTGVKAPKNEKMEQAIFEKMLFPEKTGIVSAPKSKTPLNMIVYKCKKFAAIHTRKNEFYGRNSSLIKAAAESLIIHLKNPKTFIDLLTKV